MPSGATITIKRDDFERLTAIANRVGWAPGGDNGSFSDAINHIESALNHVLGMNAPAERSLTREGDFDDPLPVLNTTHVHFSFSERKHVHFTIPTSLSETDRDFVHGLVETVADHLSEDNA